MLISIIIPTLNEESNLAVTLRLLSSRSDVELIVVDGGSHDRTVEIARQFTPYVFLSHRGRARQMNEGARHATGDILLFLHADVFLLPGSLDELQRRIIGDGAVGGAFDLQIDSPRRFLRLVGRVASWRSRMFRLPYGNQGLFMWRQVFEALGGFPDVPIMEDVGLMRRLRRAGRLTFLRTGLVTSARRWDANGIVKTTFVNGWVSFLHWIGVPARPLRKIYDGWLISGRPESEPKPTVGESSKSKMRG
jgi:rSAM/selenodomain-associated transferase 2